MELSASAIARLREMANDLKECYDEDVIAFQHAEEIIAILDGVPTIGDRLAKFGFNLEETGGNCTAYVRNDGDIEEIITVADDPCAPTSLNDTVAIGTREVCSDDERDGEGTNGYTLADVIAALENPSDEYHLLSLRLYNNFHKAGQ